MKPLPRQLEAHDEHVMADYGLLSRVGEHATAKASVEREAGELTADWARVVVPAICDGVKGINSLG
jgi:hypothetical protein